MPRKKSLTPKLFKRGANGNWCFRRFVNGKDKVINTGTPVATEAKRIMRQYVSLEIEAENRNARGELATKTAQLIMQTVRGEGIERFTFEEAFQIYLDATEDFSDLCKTYRDAFTSVCRRFFSWCRERRLTYVDEVSDEIARNYAKHLWEQQISVKTYDDYVKMLSKFFYTVDAMKKLPNRNPFNKVNIRRKKKGLISEATRRPLEPEMITAVMKAAAEEGEVWYDLFLVGLHTGMRLKDASLLRWESVKENFLEFIPFKTRRYGTVARVPISGALREMLARRKQLNQPPSPYVNPVIAKFYLKSDWVKKKSQEIFVKALGKENTILPKGEHRKANSSIYSFESFRTTFTTLLGTSDTSYRTVMEMLGWSSWSMLKIYEKKYSYNSNARDREKLESLKRLGVLSESVQGIVPALPRLHPTKEALEKLLPSYSNITIGKIYEISDVAVKKWLDKFSLKREKRIESPDLTDEEIQKIRAELQAA